MIIKNKYRTTSVEVISESGISFQSKTLEYLDFSVSAH